MVTVYYYYSDEGYEKEINGMNVRSTKWSYCDSSLWCTTWKKNLIVMAVLTWTKNKRHRVLGYERCRDQVVYYYCTWPSILEPTGWNDVEGKGSQSPVCFYRLMGTVPVRSIYNLTNLHTYKISPLFSTVYRNYVTVVPGFSYVHRYDLSTNSV